MSSVGAWGVENYLKNYSFHSLDIPNQQEAEGKVKFVFFFQFRFDIKEILKVNKNYTFVDLNVKSSSSKKLKF